MLFMTKPVPEYTTKIYDTCPWIIEHIDAVFDDVLCNLDPENSFVYGGVIRDTLANLPLMGDIDIVVEAEAFDKTINTFRYSSKWMFRGITDGAKYAKQFKSKTSSGNITKIATFYDKAGIEMQIIAPTQCEHSIVDTIPCSRTVWDIVRLVDIRCSGVMLTLDGDIYEAVDGAIGDCKKHVLEINTIVKDSVDNNHLHSRVEKFVKRGWVNNIDLTNYPIIQSKESISIF